MILSKEKPRKKTFFSIKISTEYNTDQYNNLGDSVASHKRHSTVQEACSR